MNKNCSKCGEELTNGNICISIKDKSDICSKCGMLEALEVRGDKNLEMTIKEITNADK